MFVCKECGQLFVPDCEDQTKLCTWCFEGALEEYEIQKRQRIAERNEY